MDKIQMEWLCGKNTAGVVPYNVARQIIELPAAHAHDPTWGG